MRGVEKERRSVIKTLLRDWRPDEVGDLGRIMAKLNRSLVESVGDQRDLDLSP
jgi:hypothetical protein